MRETTEIADKRVEKEKETSALESIKEVFVDVNELTLTQCCSSNDSEDSEAEEKKRETNLHDDQFLKKERKRRTGNAY